MYWLNFKPHTWSLKKKLPTPEAVSVSQILFRTKQTLISNGHLHIGVWGEGVATLPSPGETRGGPCWLESYPAYRAIAPRTIDILPSLQKGFTLVVDWGGWTDPTPTSKTYAWLLLDRWLQCFIVNVWIIWMNDQTILERMICCVVCFFCVADGRYQYVEANKVKHHETHQGKIRVQIWSSLIFNDKVYHETLKVHATWQGLMFWNGLKREINVRSNQKPGSLLYINRLYYPVIWGL